MTKKTIQQKLMFCALIGSGIILSVSFLNISKNTKPYKTKEKEIYSNFIQNFPENSKLTTLYTLNGQKEITHTTQQLTSSEKTILKENIGLSSNLIKKYTVSYNIESVPHNYTNFLLNINQHTIQAHITGLDPKSSIFMTLDTKIIEKNIPVDWSGSIMLNHKLKESNKRKRLCLIVKKKKISTLCHTIPETKGQLS
jgi:hypothetical protein